MGDKEKTVTFEELKKDMDAFFADYEKRLKALKLDPVVLKDTKKSLMLSQKDMLAFLKKQQKAGPIPLKSLPPVAKKANKNLFPWLQIKAAPGAPPDIPDGVKFMVGSKYFAAGVKTKWDSKKNKLKFEPTMGLKINF